MSLTARRAALVCAGYAGLVVIFLAGQACGQGCCTKTVSTVASASDGTYTVDNAVQCVTDLTNCPGTPGAVPRPAPSITTVTGGGKLTTVRIDTTFSNTNTPGFCYQVGVFDESNGITVDDDSDCIAGTLGPGSVQSDPIFTGFDNTTFEFIGTPGANYSVLTSKDVTINMCLVEAGPNHIRQQEGQGTFVGSFAVNLPSAELIAHASDSGNMSFTLNGTLMDIERPNAWDSIEYDPYSPGVGQLISFTHFPYKITVGAVKHYIDQASGYNRGHLDLSVEMLGPSKSAVTGILGQTLYGSTKASNASFQIPSLTYRSDSTVDTAMSRRLMTIERPLVLDFPRHAKLSALKVFKLGGA